MTSRARPAIPEGIARNGVVAIARRLDPSRALMLARGLAAGGVGAFELTLNEPETDGLRAIEAVARESSAIGIEIGAGTILTVEAANRALDAGATFLVMPHLDAELVTWIAARGIPAFPGCATPTEALTAWRAGAAAVKLFPASVTGPAFIRELHGPFPDIAVVPTGGLTLENSPGFIAAGAAAIGLGGWLLGDTAPAGVADRSRQIVAAVAAARIGLSR